MISKIILSTVLSFLIASCASMSIKDDSTNNVLAYASGKALAITINKLAPEADPELTNAWVELMERNATMAEISPLQMIGFYNECVHIIASPVKDPYGLIGDLSMLLTIYAAEFDRYNGEMVAVSPVPIEVMKFFEMGYANGRKVARKDNIK